MVYCVATSFSAALLLLLCRMADMFEMVYWMMTLEDGMSFFSRGLLSPCSRGGGLAVVY